MATKEAADRWLSSWSHRQSPSVTELMLISVYRRPIQSARVLKPWQDQSSVKGSLPRIERGMHSRRCPTIYVLARLGASNQAEEPPPL